MRPRPSRRGVTLIEMLVVVALVVLIMTIIVSVFKSATGAVRASQTTNDMDQAMRRLEATLRQDLLGVTAKLTPPLDPKDNLGYLEYGENAFADAQGEDADDWISFTAKAPVGQPFTGRYWNPNAPAGVQNPTMISSEYAEIIYFLRNGNLYRRVLLIVPGLALSNLTAFSSPTMFAGATSGWMSTNDISAHPNPTLSVGGGLAPLANSLGDLTNRQNRFARPRFTPYHSAPADATRNGIHDDYNNNGVPDYYPTLYPNVITPAGGLRATLLNDPATAAGYRDSTVTTSSYDLLPFPFIFPGSYSNPATPFGTSNLGQIHNVFPLNHSPLESGDSLGTPANTTGGVLETYWGWPTWKETASNFWTDPVAQVNLAANGQQSPGLSWYSTTGFRALPPLTTNFLTVVNDTGSTPATFTSTSVPFRPTAQPFNDGAGSSHFALQSTTPNDAFWANSWEDDLIMTGVRSFDIKAYDPALTPTIYTVPIYVDLGGSSPNLNGFQHEGRMPPLTTDGRFDPQLFLKTGVQRNIGDDSASTLRLRRVWDSWSTEYSFAPDTPYDPTAGPAGGGLPVYPSYPPPYPAALRGIQIQIRLVNQPDTDRLRVMTIRHDFSDKL